MCAKKRARKPTARKSATPSRTTAKRPAAKKPARPPKSTGVSRPGSRSKPVRQAANNRQAAGAEQVDSPELGIEVSQYEAVLEKLRLYPMATTQEIVAMFKLDGSTVSPALVQRVRRELKGS